MQIHIEQLNDNDTYELFDFECRNREYFEKSVPGRGDDYYQYENFKEIMKELLREQEEGRSYFHLIKDEQGRIVGRINLVDIETTALVQAGHLGYRIGEAYIGQGLATKAVDILLKKLPGDYGIHEVHAKTTLDNTGSQKVLEKNQFTFVKVDDNTDSAVLFKHNIWKAEYVHGK